MENNLKYLMEKDNLTQSELSKKTKIPQTTISGWFNNNRKPSYEALIILSDFFNVSIDYLVGRENDYGNIVVQNEISNDERELLNLFNSLVPRMKARLIGYAFALKEQQQNI